MPFFYRVLFFVFITILFRLQFNISSFLFVNENLLLLIHMLSGNNVWSSLNSFQSFQFSIRSSYTFELEGEFDGVEG